MELSKSLFLAFIVAALFITACSEPKVGTIEPVGVEESGEPDLVEFAQCITEKGAVLYGADWCGHCKNQRKQFGEAVEHVNYVECAGARSHECKEAGIQAYPTWKFADGSKALGRQDFEVLAERTGCEL